MKANILHDFKDSLILLNTRYRVIRESKGKVGLWLFIIGIAFAILATSYTGTFLKMVASSTNSSLEAAQIYASTYLNYYLNGELGPLVATTLGLAVISVMIAPFTGTSATSVIPNHALVSVRATSRHRFTDSVLTQFFASISLLQLLTLTAVASLLTIDGGHKMGVLYAWASWPVLVILSTLFVWVAEYLYRKFGESNRLLMLLLALAAIAATVYFMPEQASTVFGVGTAYASIIQGVSSWPVLLQVTAFAIIPPLWILFAFVAHRVSRAALAHPDTFAKQANKTKTIKPRKTSPLVVVQMMNVAVMQIWRNSEIRKPIMLSGGFSIIATFLLAENTSLMATVVFIIPLMISLSWGANVFGVVGTGLPWLLSKPFATRSMLWVFAGLQMLIVFVVSVLAMAPVLVTGRMDTATAGSFLLAVIASSAVMTRSAISKSVNSPFPYKSGYRGEPILPPATLIAYTLRFSLWSGMLGLIVFSVVSGLEIKAMMAFLAVAWSVFRLWRLDNKFQKDPEIRNKIVFTVAYT